MDNEQSSNSRYRRCFIWYLSFDFFEVLQEAYLLNGGGVASATPNNAARDRYVPCMFFDIVKLIDSYEISK